MKWTESLYEELSVYSTK